VRAVLALAGVLLAAAACGSSGGGRSAERATVVGRVLSAPSCPVERSDSPCPPRPVPGASVAALRAGHVAARTHTGPGGGFRLTLRPGSYVLRATNAGALATTAEKRIVLTAAATTRVTLVVDSGIR
jgi:Carboxypeptidase regulatory-like domain